MQEQWLKIPGFEVYEISNHGNLRRRTKHRGFRYLNPEVTRLGYVRAKLCVGDKQRRVLVHRLVADAFLEKPEWATEINHLDGIKENNAASNLEWTTRSGNATHAFRSGLSKIKRGNENPWARLTEKQVVEIKTALKEYRPGMVAELGRKYGVTPEAISMIKVGKNWSHVIV